MDAVIEIFENPWVSLGGKVLLVALIVPLSAMVLGFAEMKLSAKMQGSLVRTRHSRKSISSRESRSLPAICAFSLCPGVPPERRYFLYV